MWNDTNHATGFTMSSDRSFSYDYDPNNDVLYLSVEPCVPAYGSGPVLYGITVRRSITTDEVVGLTIIGFQRSMRDGWLKRLASEIPSPFSVEMLEKIFSHIVNGRLEGSIDIEGNVLEVI